MDLQEGDVVDTMIHAHAGSTAKAGTPLSFMKMYHVTVSYTCHGSTTIIKCSMDGDDYVRQLVEHDILEMVVGKYFKTQTPSFFTENTAHLANNLFLQ